MSKKQGYVESFNPQGKKVGRGSIVYSFKLDDGEWYRTGFDKPPIEAGDQVQFTYEDGQYGKEADVKNMKVKKGDGPKPSSSGGSAGNGREKYWEDKAVSDLALQKRIGYAGCLNSAIALMANLQSVDAFPVSKSKMGGKDGVGATQAVLVRLADEFWDLINTRVDALNEESETPVPNGKDELEQTEKAAATEATVEEKDPDDFDSWD